MTCILGIGGYTHDASAALLVDGRLASAVQEERLTRVKHAGGFPYEAIKYCVDQAGVTLKDVEAVTFYTKRSNWDGYLLDVVKQAALNAPYTATHVRGLVASLGYRVQRSVNFRADFGRFLHTTGLAARTFHDYDHHACHAASAYYSSPFDHAVILCVDGGGDGRTTTGWLGKDGSLTDLRLDARLPHSMGLFYTRMTRFLGFASSGDEYKVMGLAAYGSPRHASRVAQLVQLTPNGYRLNPAYFTYQYAYALSQKFFDEFGPARQPGSEITEFYADMAASAQRVFEDVMTHLAGILQKRTGARNLAIAGGSSLNCLANGKLLKSGVFENIFVPPAASDPGTCIGAAQYHYHQVLGRPRTAAIDTDSWGPEYSDAQIAAELNRAGVPFTRVNDPAATAASLIAAGQIVGWFQGRMEFGPRALGQRSILADPRRKEIKDRVNSTIKFREEFRPFAPSCLEEHAASYFQLDCESPFMTFTVDVRPEQRDRIPGVVHVDGTSRVQTVSDRTHPLYYALIRRFFDLTGVPLVLNTSFNLAGEPIVCAPFDAVRTFFTSGIDTLIMGNYMITKRAPDVRQ